RKREYKEITKKKKRIRVKGKKYKKKKIIYKKREKKKAGKAEKRTGKRRYRYFIYAFINYRGYRGMYYEQGKYGTRYFEYLDKYEMWDAINNARSLAIYEMNYICQSLSSIEFTVSYVNVKYDAVKKHTVSRKAISQEKYDCNDVKGLI
ncbi:MAG: hypothetical protein ACP5JE_05515, partial [Thermoplasmata archaeon]